VCVCLCGVCVSSESYSLSSGYIHIQLYSMYTYPLRAGWSVYRIPVGAKFPTPVHTGPEAYPDSYRVELYFCSPSGWVETFRKKNMVNPSSGLNVYFRFSSDMNYNPEGFMLVRRRTG
jgi:hypothetical protein